MGGRRHTWLALSAAVMTSLAVLTVSGSAGPAPQPEVKALFFGDSLFAGAGATPKRPVEVRTAVDRLGWRGLVDARGGTGYTTGGTSGGRPYLYRLQHGRALRGSYDVIVLEGGTNDAHHGSLTELHAAALRTVDFLRERQPYARVVMVGAFAPPGIALDRYEVVDRVLSGVAQERGLQYVSQLDFSGTTDRGLLSSDRFHPSDAGYAVLGKALAKALRQ